MTENIDFLGSSETPEYLNLKYTNRHGLITRVTGAGIASQPAHRVQEAIGGGALYVNK